MIASERQFRGQVPMLNRSQIEREAPELALLFPPGTTTTRDELATWDALEPQALLARLKACFDPWWAFPRLAPAQIDIFRSVIHPEVVIRASETDLAVLDCARSVTRVPWGMVIASSMAWPARARRCC